MLLFNVRIARMLAYVRNWPELNFTVLSLSGTEKSSVKSCKTGKRAESLWYNIFFVYKLR